MSYTVDNRVVEMQFDNSNFERNVSKSMSTLDKLKSSLNLGSASKSFDELNRSANAVSFNGLTKSVDSVIHQFSALEVMATTALATITHQAVLAGERIVKALSIQGAIDGFKEYELNMDSIKVIMNSTGESLETVQYHLDNLNEYADKTIYSFSDMTRNIGKFTNAGVELKDAEVAMIGISNAAAIAGAGTAEASRAMYNIAQSLSGGYMQLIDWKSIENANMATVEFKENLLETALALGTVKKKGDEYYTLTKNQNGKTSGLTGLQAMFKDGLQYQWLTSDVLIETLKKYGDETTEIGKKGWEAAQEVTTFTKMMAALTESVGTGWADSMKYILGDYNEAKKMWTGLNNVLSGIIDNFTKKRNTLLKEWHDLGGRTILLDSIKIAFEGISKSINTVKKAFHDIFPSLTSFQWYLRMYDLRDFARSLVPTEEALQTLSKVSSTVFSVFRYGIDAVKQLVKAFSPLTQLIEPIKESFGGVFMELTDWIGGLAKNRSGFGIFDTLREKIQYLVDLIITNNVIPKIVEHGRNLVNTVIDIGKAIYEHIVGTGAIPVAIDLIKKFALGIVNAATALYKAFVASGLFPKIMDTLKGFILSLEEGIKFVYGKLVEGGVFDKLKKSVKNAGDTIIDTLTNLSTNPVYSKITSAMSKMAEAIKSAFKTMVNAISSADLSISKSKLFSAFEKIWEFTKKVGSALFKFFKDVFSTILSHAGGVDIMQNFLNILTLILTGTIADKLVGFTKTISDFGDILDTIADAFEMLQAKVQAGIFRDYAISIAILAGSILVLSSIDTSKLSATMPYIAMLMAGLTGVMFAMQKMMGGGAGVKTVNNFKELFTRMQDSFGKSMQLKVMGTNLIKIAASLLIVSLALKTLANVAPKQLIVSAITLVGMLAVMAMVMTKLDKLNVSASPMIAMGAALTEVALALKIVSGIDVKTLFQDAVVLISLLATMAFAMIALDELKVHATPMIAMATALIEIALTLKLLSSMDVDTLFRNTVILIALLATMTFSMIALDELKVHATPMIAMATALLLVATTLKKLAVINWKSLLKACIAITGVIAILTVATLALGKMKNKGGGATILAMGAGLLLVAGALKIIASIPADNLKLTAMVLIALLATFTIAGMVLSSATAGLLAFGASILMVGAGLLAISVAINLLVVAIGGLNAVMALGATAITAAIVSILTGLAEGLAQFILTIIKRTTDMVDAGVELVQALIRGVKTLIPDIVNLGAEIILSVLDGIENNIYKITEKTVAIITKFTGAISDHMGEIIASGTKLVTSFVQGVADAFSEEGGEGEKLLKAFTDAIGNVIDTIIYILTGERISEIFAAGEEMFGEGSGFLGGILAVVANIGVWIEQHVINPILDTLGLGEWKLFESAEDLGHSIINGIKHSFGLLTSEDVIKSAVDFLDYSISKDGYDYVKKNLSTFYSFFNEAVINEAFRRISPPESLQYPVYPELGNAQALPNQLYKTATRNQSISAALGFTPTNTLQQQNDAIAKLATAVGNASSNGATSTNNQNNNFYITGDDPKAIANEVSEILQRQLERKKIVWE